MVVVRRAMGKKTFKDWKDLNDNWGKAVERNMDRMTMCGKCKLSS